MREIWLRIKMPLNTFWVRVRAFLLVISAFSVLLTEVLPQFINNPLMPAYINNILQHVYMFGAFGVMIAQLTVRDTQELKHKKDNG